MRIIHNIATMLSKNSYLLAIVSIMLCCINFVRTIKLIYCLALKIHTEIIKEGVTDVFNVTHMSGIEGRDSYIHCLYTFVNAFYRETDVNNLLQNECISLILTPSDEAFIMLCVMVYFRDRTDCKNDIKERDVSTFENILIVY